MPMPTEGDLETAYRVLKHCHPEDHKSAGVIVAQYRAHIVRDIRARLIAAYAAGNVQALIDDLAGVHG